MHVGVQRSDEQPSADLDEAALLDRRDGLEFEIERLKKVGRRRYASIPHGSQIASWLGALPLQLMANQAHHEAMATLQLHQKK
jgi:hypothetical protein